MARPRPPRATRSIVPFRSRDLRYRCFFRLRLRYSTADFGWLFCLLSARWPCENLLIQSNIQLAKFSRDLQLLAIVWRFGSTRKVHLFFFPSGRVRTPPLLAGGGQLAAWTEVRPWSHLARGKLVAFRLWSHLSNCLPVLNWMNGTNPPPRTCCSMFFLFFRIRMLSQNQSFLC